jgi:hypothetical protein
MSRRCAKRGKGGEAPVPAKSIHDNQSPEDPTRPYRTSERRSNPKLTATNQLKHTTGYITSVSAFTSPQRANSHSPSRLHYLPPSINSCLRRPVTQESVSLPRSQKPVSGESSPDLQTFSLRPIITLS